MSATARTQSFARRRSSTANLVPLIIPPPDNSETVREVLMEAVEPRRTEIEEEGRELFHNFLNEEIKRETSVDLDDTDIPSNIGSTGFRNPLWAKAGINLRQMADQFAQTRGRALVRNQAQQMGFEVRYEEFREFLFQLFEAGHVTSERIVVLFYFCSDIAMNALRKGKDLFMQFFNWSMSFIIEHVCSWVYRNGGWGQVLRSPFNSVRKIVIWLSAAAAVVTGMHIYLRYK